jgi:fumarate reductase subunit D
MKNTKGWSLIIICSILLLIFIIFFILITPGILSGKNADMAPKEIISSTIGFTVVITLLILGLRNGLKRIKSKKKKEISDFKDSLEIEFKGQIKYSDYRNLMLNLRYNKPIYLLIFGILILLGLSIYVNEQEKNNYFFFITIVVLILSPFLSLRQIKKTYYSNKLFQEKINYKINKNSIQIKSSTVDTILYWNHFQKIKETSSFFLLYQSEGLAILLDKKMFSQIEINKFNHFISSLHIDKNSG